MSTKRIHEALEWLRCDDATLANEEMQREYVAAKAELEAIEKAARNWYGQETQGLVLEADALAPLERIALETNRNDVAVTP